METTLFVITLAVSITSASAGISHKPSLINQQVPSQQYTNTWVAQLLDPQHKQLADLLASKHGLVNLGQVGNLDGYYGFRLGDIVYKRDIHQLSDLGKRDDITQALAREPNVGFIEQQLRRQMFKRDYRYTYPTDPNFNQQWSLVNNGQTNGRKGLDLNVEPVWLQGVNGSGVVVSIMDDGLEVRHPDLSPNYDSFASWDFVYDDNDPTPTNYYGDEPDSHGTGCAGEIAMAKNNNKCGVGVAYDSNIGCLKFDGSDATDVIEARSLGYNNDYIQVYSNSWGPSDLGFVVSGPGPLLSQTFQNSVTKGRSGKGSIFVWAAGNGGFNFDSCAADGYASSIYTVAVGSADQNAGQASYDENCAGKMAVTYSFNSDTFSEDGSYDPYNQVSTTTLNEKCTDGFTGTSASAPLMSGVITLALQANPDLSWRDVQYLIAYTSNPDELSAEGWSVNGGGLKVSHQFGFGAVDAEALVTRAKHWITVPPQIKSTSTSSVFANSAQPGQPLVMHFSGPQNIQFSEHVVLTATLSIGNKGTSYSLEDFYNFIKYEATDEASVYRWLQDPHPRRGDIKLELTSPQGTTSTILPYRKYDFVNTDDDANGNAYYQWPFMSVHYWGEDPSGEWTLTVTYKSSSGYVSVRDVEFAVYGTNSTPQAVLNSGVGCDKSCVRGCYGPSSRECDTCKNLRVVSTLECVDVCPNNTISYKNSYCTDYLITIPQEVNIALIVGIVLGILAGVVCILCIATCVLIYVCRRKKVERDRNRMYRILHPEGSTPVSV